MDKDKLKETYKSNHDNIYELLQQSAYHGDVELFRLLLDRIYPEYINKSNMRRRNLLHHAVYDGNICKLLFDYIEGNKIRDIMVLYENDFNDTPLMEAICYHNIEAIKVFLDRMTKEEIQYSNFDQDRAIDIANEEGTPEVVKLIETRLKD